MRTAHAIATCMNPPVMNPDIQRYLEGKSDLARPICMKLREIILKADPGLEEVIRWGGPTYKGKGLVCGLRASLHHVTLFFFRGASMSDPGGVFTDGQHNATERAVKFTSLADVKVKSLTALIKEAMKVDAGGPPAKKAKRPDLPVPPVLADALRQDARAKKFFDTIAPSSRRDFCEWIGTARQEATLQRRLEKTMAMLGEGICLHDLYKGK